ncbi:hypothetical protein [Actinokineospora enzanensis]|uniref:hypothetical protein n=1 Tax=Actinokineospora enzanensis TaxID=155975 RepID=UPI0003A4ADFD|nr:hypothetical protein [Actinokineospora enzanensis]
MATALWIVTAVLAGAFIVWRLRRANTTLNTILREERERTGPAEFDDEFEEIPAPRAAARTGEPHRAGRERRSD